ncbi:SDR family NAD(P)-dependent oxidoreductase [Synechococcus sp. ATX 2A4]|uniref:SDR family NAD(P)-dependent oxidoreductase n=1 Tax=Synechococcus sp. ATX 2A4 TaxID=2823727 RepID=UPI0020CEBCB7|nr:SDR family NAD(P)-dependent oxidoreductase [Synechococcus sp. ATX 2A4]
MSPLATRPPLSSWSGHALVVGAGGIGRALLQALAERAPGLSLWGASRRGWPARPGELELGARALQLDLCDDGSLNAAAASLQAQAGTLRLVINTAGLLHDGAALQPEKRLSQLNRAALERLFAVNAYGPILLAQALEPLLPATAPALFASLSARVGSIGDNGLGGWYGYRSAKAAQNQLLRCLALEWRRRRPLVTVTLLHPGTTATELSAPFSSGVPPQRLFSPERAAQHLLDVLELQGPEQSGSFLAWDGSPIPW